LAAPEAVAVPVVVTGGQAPAQAPVQLDMSPVSFAHRYTARPEPLVRKVPPEDVAVSMTVAPEALDPLLEEEDPAGEAGAAAVPLLAALLQAATTTAAPSAPPTPATILVRLDRRLNLDFCIVLISRPVRVPDRLRVIHCR
jgi:hypothetical protein